MKAIKIPEGSDPIEYLRKVIKESGYRGGLIVGIGGMKWAKVGIFNGKTYHVELIVAKEDRILEVAPLVGNFFIRPDGDVDIHVHINLGRDHGEVYAGHLVKAEVFPFLEVFLLESENEVSEVFSHRLKK